MHATSRRVVSRSLLVEHGSTSAAGAESTARIDADLLLGVLSFRLRERLGMRNAIRQLACTDNRVALRFVMAVDEADDDAARGDVLLFRLPNASRRLLGKVLLQNAFFRFGLDPRHRLRWIGRADDDALFNATVVVDDLWRLRCTPGVGEYVAYGPFRNWFAWMPRPIMQAVCWSHGPRLFARLKARDGVGGNATHACL